MGFYVDQILSRGMVRVMDSREHRQLRKTAAEGLFGDVVEVGFGAGLNLPALPEAVRALYAIDPDRVGQKLAASRIAEVPQKVHFAGLDGQRIELDTDSMDAALSTWTLCTIPDVAEALSELRRVLKPGGKLHFLEHGLSDEPGMARWQHRLTPLQRRFAGGCRLDLEMDTLIRAAGFQIIELENFYMRGPKLMRVMTYMYRGIAVSP